MATVVLRPWAETDLPVLERANTPAMTRFLGGPESDHDVRERHARYLRLNASGEAWMYAIEVDGVAAGGIGFWPIVHDGSPGYETGWHVLPEWAGRGVARAALRRLLPLVVAAPPRGLLYAYPSVENVWERDPAAPLPRTETPS